MDLDLQQLESAALRLPTDARVELARRLLESLDHELGPLTLLDLEARAHGGGPDDADWAVVRERARRLLDP